MYFPFPPRSINHYSHIPNPDHLNMDARKRAEIGDDLYNACEAGDLPTVLAYISKKRSLDPTYSPPLAAIMYVAAGRDHSAIVSHCLSSGATVSDELLKQIVVERPIRTYEVILKAKAIDPNYFIPWFGDVLTCVATDNDIDFVKLCLSHGADPNRNLFEEDKTALAAVAETASIEIATLLLEHGAEIKNSAAVVAAAIAGKTDMVRFLLAKGADVDEMGIYHPYDKRCEERVGSALHQAARKGHQDIVALLLREGADVNLKDLRGRTPLALAEAEGNDAVKSLLQEHGGVS